MRARNDAAAGERAPTSVAGNARAVNHDRGDLRDHLFRQRGQGQHGAVRAPRRTPQRPRHERHAPPWASFRARRAREPRACAPGASRRPPSAPQARTNTRHREEPLAFAPTRRASARGGRCGAGTRTCGCSASCALVRRRSPDTASGRAANVVRGHTRATAGTVRRSEARRAGSIVRCSWLGSELLSSIDVDKSPARISHLDPGAWSPG